MFKSFPKLRVNSPVPYGIPDDGPVAQLMGVLGRHIYRPGHLHFQIQVRLTSSFKLLVRGACDDTDQ
jgi:catechol 1,2-dioxygenase